MADTGKEVATRGGSTLAEYPMLGEQGIEQMEAVQANLGDTELVVTDLDRIGIPPGGSTTWQIPTLEGEVETKTLDGIIVAWQASRTYWETPLDEREEVTPPDCSSPDGKWGIGRYEPGSTGNPSGECSSCPMNQWGSAGDGGRGKACREGRQLYMIRPNAVLPLVVGLPVTSIPNLRKYFMRLAGESVPYYGVVSSLALERVERGGYRWSVVIPTSVARLSPEETDVAKAYGKKLSDQLPKSSPTPPERGDAGVASGVVDDGKA